MFHLGLDFEKFLNRYLEKYLVPDEEILFSKNRIGAAKLDLLVKKYETDFEIKYDYFNKKITIYTVKEVETSIQTVSEEIDQILKDLSKTSKEIFEEKCEEKCAFCLYL